MRAQNVTGPVAYHAEGPCWSPTWGGLRFVDVNEGDLLTLVDDSVARLHTGFDIAAFVRPRVSGGYLLGTRDGVALADDVAAPPTRSLILTSDRGVRMNDAGVTPQGELLAGSMSFDGSPTGFLYRVDAELRWTELLSGIGCSNGLAFAPDGGFAYYTDSLTSRIDVLEFTAGELITRRSFVAIDPELGLPDGLTIDRDGNVWVALWGGSAVHAYDPSGTLIQVVDVSAAQVSACTFGGDDLQTLYITTSREGLGADEDPEAGSLFSVRPGSTGLPVVPFAG